VIWVALLLAPVAAQNAGVSRGAEIFSKTCAVPYCHGPQGSAGRAPQLAGRNFDRFPLFKAVGLGIPETSMPGFQNILSLEDLDTVVDYVMSLATKASATSGSKPAPSKPPPLPPEIRQGRDLFFDPARVGSCGTCHLLDGWGVAVGPDLASASPPNPPALRALPAKNINRARPVNEEPFPALVVEQTKDRLLLYDLTAPLPVLRTFRRHEVTLEEGAGWNHAAVTRIYTDPDLEKILVFLRRHAAQQRGAKR